MIIKSGKKVTDVIKCDKVVNQIIRNGICIYNKKGSDIPYLYTDKDTVWIDPENVFNIYSNTKWAIYGESDRYLEVDKDTCWLIPDIGEFEILSDVDWNIN